MQLVWFKRDLRLGDHRPLARATAAGPVLCLFLYEPDILTAEDFDPSHLVFQNQALEELDRGLRERGNRLVIRHGSAVEELERVHETLGIDAIWSHEETGNRVTYDRDLRVGAWAREKGIRWNEIPQTGVIRRLEDREGWSSRWMARMREPLTPTPERIVAPEGGGIESRGILAPSELGLAASERTEAWSGGESEARGVLRSFLEDRGVNYRADMSSPVTGEQGCSRLSPYLAYGCMSLRTVYQATLRQKRRLQERRRTGADFDSRWLPSLSSFEGRLRWHCHFMQKLEDEPDIEFRNMARAYDGLREDAFDERLFRAWCEGRTGYPLVDACMRCLEKTGWINFRMRAMLVSFASYHLWLHWRPTAVFLARRFLDFEAGIHYSQVQMQSGTTGINAIRIYSPAKQVKDQDPRGVFIRHWVPELREIPDKFLPEPHRMAVSDQDAHGCRIGVDYPAPIVDHGKAYREARQRIYRVKGTSKAREESQVVFRKHGSRRTSARRRPAR